MGRENDFKVFKNVFDKFTIDTLWKLMVQGHFDGLVSPWRIGKESNVFIAEKGNGKVIVKIYRLENLNFNALYRYIRTDPRFVGIKNQRRKVIFTWVQREYRNLLIAREVINVPTPYAFKNNVLVMELIGSDRPAPLLKDAAPKYPSSFSETVFKNIERLALTGLVHGDLSEYNILNYRDEPIFIDFSQGTLVKDPHAMELLERDIRNAANFFAKHHVKLSFKEEFEKIKKKITRSK